jgi:hypothetical protein
VLARGSVILLKIFMQKFLEQGAKHVSLMERKTEVAATSSTNISLKNRLLMFLVKFFLRILVQKPF